MKKIFILISLFLSIFSFSKLSKEEYRKKSALELATLVKEKKVKPEELVNLAYELLGDDKLNAVISTRKEEAINEAKNLKFENQPFLGVPIFMKGLGGYHGIKGESNTIGFTFLKDNKYSEDGEITKQLKNLGFIVLGQTNYPEFGLRNITQSELYGTTRNPYNPDYQSGGSSGGSAVLVSDGIVPVASASDGGGSIRIPASWTGIIGFKPSRGVMKNLEKRDTKTLVSHFPLTKNSDDTKVLFENLVDKNIKISNEVKDIKKLKIGYTYYSPMGTKVSEDARNAIREAVQFLKNEGFTVEEIYFPINGRDVMRDYTVLSIDNAKYFGNIEKMIESKNLTKYNMDPLVWAFYITYRDIDKTYLNELVNKTWENAKNYEKIMEEFHKEYPIILTPTNAYTAPLKTDSLIDSKDRELMYNMDKVAIEDRYDLLFWQWEPMLTKTPFTQVYNLIGEPAISLPTYISKEGLPLGIMLNSSWGNDRILLQFMQYFNDKNMLKIKY